jgi:hypothetical protein
MVEDRLNGRQQPVEAPTSELLRNAASSSGQILVECRQPGWSDTDLGKLEKLHSQTEKPIDESQ